MRHQPTKYWRKEIMNSTIKQTMFLEDLIKETKTHLVSLNYAKDTLRHMDNCWKLLANYAQVEGVSYFTTEFGHSFLKEQYGIEPFTTLKTSFKRNLRRAVMILSDYQRNGIIFKRQPTHQHIWPVGYRELCETFMNEAVRNRLSSGTQRQYRVQLEKLTAYLTKSGAESISQVTAGHVDSYIATYMGYAKSSISYACYILRTFFNYALEKGLITDNLAAVVPTVKVNQRANLPSAFTKEEIERLLAAVDRGNPQGKRDYAILLMAIRYGMRVGEITALKLNNLDFVSKKITYIQSKTGNPILVDMLENVGWALIDYLKNARPKTDATNVFVRLVAPYDAFAKSNNLGNIMQKYLSRAGIKQTNDRHYGMHTIRHSLASHLLEQGNPLHVVSEVLGHLELNSTMIYTKIDLPMLSLCALEVPNE
jgi:integrase/recombinase XerD